MNEGNNVEISVIIPCYNVPEEYIRRMLDSVKAQTFEDYEIIVIDDGSKAEYHEALERLVLVYEKVTLITTPNNGVSQARNIGVQKAKGTFIAFLDADDLVSKYFLQEAHDAFLNTGADFVIGGTRYVDVLDPAMVEDTHQKVEYDIYRAEEIRKLYYYLGCLRQSYRFNDSYIGRGPVSRVLKRNIAVATPFHKELIVGEDHIWNLEVLSHCNCVCIVKSQWYWYWKNPDSALHHYNPNMFAEIKKALIITEALMNYNDDSEYLIYYYLLFDSMHTIRRSVFEHPDSTNRELIKNIKKSIYTEYPWTKIKEWRFFKICPPKYKIMALLYRFHLLFFYWEARGKLLHK